ncbi:3-methyl-2-oxobutanoate hydroxymethyltransferase [Haloplanus vescus]|uniref:3-methyl-2-oxobutanoate hydroxymethyltransferase n=1 Tax=Haloplanus vescus TaxID=555874 RepID=A0A1H3WAH6_9EURY|nr:3-methyl-2-oxobutanoate hydroxymethyltransferase [Haloplanus vescus]SDZ84106.1 3-methyl-2-oxobutanoate hydroxymethyltransferase [Haloplanus vescus]
MPTVREIQRGARDEPLTMLTAYDAPTAAIVDEAGIDVVLVGDSVGNAMLGYDTTVPVTLDQVASHTGAVARAVDDALVVADMPFLSYGASEAESIENAGRLIKEAGANAVKLESGTHTVELTERLVELGIPVMAHLGLTPQRVNQVGGYTQQGTTDDAAAEIRDLAAKHEAAGAFSLVLEHVPDELAASITDALDIPVIGIGAGGETDGQVLVVTDVLGLSESVPPFAESFGDVREEMEEAVAAYRDAVEDGSFP